MNRWWLRDDRKILSKIYHRASSDGSGDGEPYIERDEDPSVDAFCAPAMVTIDNEKNPNFTVCHWVLHCLLRAHPYLLDSLFFILLGMCCVYLHSLLLEVLK